MIRGDQGGIIQLEESLLNTTPLHLLLLHVLLMLSPLRAFRKPFPDGVAFPAAAGMEARLYASCKTDTTITPPAFIFSPCPGEWGLFISNLNKQQPLFQFRASGDPG